jgi:hypothetical protein
MEESMKNVIIPFGILLSLFVINVIAQPDTLWTKTFGGDDIDSAYAMQQTKEGGYIITGFTLSYGPGYGDVYLIKTDSSGDSLWTKTFGGYDNDSGSSVRQTADGGYIITGWTWSFGSGGGDVYLIKTDSSGDALWTNTFGGDEEDYGSSVQQTADGGYIITGWTWSFGSGGGDVYLIKTGSSGSALWTNTFGGEDEEHAYSVQQTTDGGYIIAGSTKSFGEGFEDVYLIKTDSSGDTLWTNTFGGGGSDFGLSVQQTADGGYIIAGSTESFGMGGGDVYLIKTDSSGDSLWTNTFGGGNTDCGLSVQQTTDDGYIIAGWTKSFGEGFEDMYLIKTDSSGDTLWTNTFGGDDSESGASVQQTTGGGYIVAGYTESYGAGEQDVYLIKTGIETGIEKHDRRSKRNVPNYKMLLKQNLPNPFNPETTIPYSLDEESRISLRIYSISGKLVKTLEDQTKQPGDYSVTWRGKNESGQPVSSGIYVYRLEVGNSVETRRMLLLK